MSSNSPNPQNLISKLFILQLAVVGIVFGVMSFVNQLVADRNLANQDQTADQKETPLARYYQEKKKTPPPVKPKVVAASQEARRAITTFEHAKELKIGLFAAEPMLANPVTFTFDRKGRMYVVETFRLNNGVSDNREHKRDWLFADLAATTVEDRLAYHKRLLPDQGAAYTKQDDRIRLLEDTTGDGKADRSIVFANRFNGLVDGIAAGLFHRNGKLLFACIPHLYSLEDSDGDGKADMQKSLHYGYGVHTAFLGHDLHGLTLGPDGRLYFSMGDRGFNIKLKDRHLVNVESGAIFRCELDGSNLEVFADGVRNPQELAFDDFGNLFTGENNSDSGDKARWVYLVEGGDTGWRMAYQYLKDRGPFNREKIWHPFHPGQPAFIIPPIINFADGPSGLAYYPGTGLGPKYQGTFFLCDFRGTPVKSGIRTIKVKPKGAFFEVTNQGKFIWKILPTDLDFGADGKMYITDWADSWDGLGKGRVFTAYDPEHLRSPIVLEVKKLLREGFAHRKTEELKKLLSHVDRRVRLEAQIALAEKKELAIFLQVVTGSKHQLARIHALWGLGQIARLNPSMKAKALSATLLKKILLDEDEDEEVRAQVAKLMKDYPVQVMLKPLITALKDENERVRYFAAMALGKLGDVSALEPVYDLLIACADQDPILRHGGIMAIKGIAQAKQGKHLSRVLKAVSHTSPSVRIATIVALRKLKSKELVRFLKDSEELLVVEAVRAIHDLPIKSGFDQVAKLLSRSTQSESLLRRSLNANLHLGTQAHANQVAHFAARETAPEKMRMEALEILRIWHEPSPQDRVLGMWRPIKKRSKQIAITAMKQALPGLLTSKGKVRALGVKIAAEFGIKDVVPILEQMVWDEKNVGESRASALRALAGMGSKKIEGMVRKGLISKEAKLRAAARDLLAQSDIPAALKSLKSVLAISEGDLAEKQAALSTLGKIKHIEVAVILSQQLSKLLTGKLAPELELDLLTVAKQQESLSVKRKLKQYESTRSNLKPLSFFRETLHGGNVERGRQIFFEKQQVYCVRCHQADGRGGLVGPDLSGIGLTKDRRYLLESLVYPNQTIAKGFETVNIITEEGKVYSGIVQKQDEKILQIVTAEGKVLKIEKEEIDEQSKGLSAMPADLRKHLTKQEIRDLVEFLIQQKQKEPEPNPSDQKKP